ncbi:MAG TPA: FAD:protein FMN transferase [Acidimicrobiales bacterium]|nr:FAD:protein FMN transferase [Acidimicrobiales bacterium]
MTPAAAPGHLVLRSMRALGTTATLVVTDTAVADEAVAVLRQELDAVDLACSRFRRDSELWNLARDDGGDVVVSPLLFEAVRVACAAAERTGGAVDPTVGRAVEALGYDRDFAAVAPTGDPLDLVPRRAPGWWRIECDPVRSSVRVPAGVLVDLGATAKALSADRAAARIAEGTRCGVLVNLGGDVAVAGPAPPGGWAVGIAPDSSTPLEAVTHTVAITAGGLASSSTSVRSWRRGDRRLHHIVDPRTGDVATTCWTLVSATGASCVDANAATTAAVVWGPEAPARLEALGHAARLVHVDGSIVRIGGWPADERLSPEVSR